jgi:hypothetical protein
LQYVTLETKHMTGSILAQLKLKLISGRPICSDPASMEYFTIAKDWISQCLTSKEHSFCQGNHDVQTPPFGVPGILPTRLIDVGPLDGSGCPRLVLSSNIKASGIVQYAALSHCWGGSEHRLTIETSPNADTNSAQVKTDSMQNEAPTGLTPLTTLTLNLEERMRSIPMEILPLTFRDAVTITRNIGLRYIWIDSLCIIQDSKEDWEHEAARMADVYKNSYVTISAESASNSHEGILKQRRFDFEPIEIPFNSKAHNIRTSMYLRPVQDDWETSITGAKSKLCSRAWVLQESLLAPRTLHYGAQQMFWECKSFSHAEGDMTPIPQGLREREWSWSRNKRFLSDLSTGSGGEGAAAVKEVLYMRWNSILENYSARKMTNPSDVFPALAGLAGEFNLYLKDEYVAGLWKTDLHRGLLWRVVEPEPCKIATPYRAPSWSWASKVGQISGIRDADYIVGDYRAEIEAKVTLQSRVDASAAVNVYGEVIRGLLKIRGRSISATHWPAFEDKPWKHQFIQNSEDSEGYLFRDFDIGTEDAVTERHQKGRTLSLVQIATWAWGHSPDDEGTLHFLVLESGDNGDLTIHTRVGVVQMYSYATEWLDGWEIREFVVA